MLPIKFFLLLMPLVVTSTQGFLMKKINAGENTNTDSTYIENIQTIVEDVKDALNLKKQTVADTVSAVGDAKFGLIKDIKDSKKNFIEDILASKIAKVNAIKTAKEDFMNKILGHKQPFFFLFQSKPHQETTTSSPTEGLKNKFVNFFLNFFDKFQGHFDKNSHESSNEIPLAPISYPSSDSFSPVEEIATSGQDSESQTNFFPSGSPTVESEYPVTQSTSAPLGYIKVIQVPYEFTQAADVQSGFQSSQLSPSSNYDQPKADDIVPSEYPAVEFTNHQTNSHASSSYYNSYPTSVKSARAIYGTPN